MINVFYQCSTLCTFFINFRVEDIYNTQLFAKAVSKNGVVFFGLVNNSALGCLNDYQPIQRQNIVSNLLSFFFFLGKFFPITRFSSFFPHEKYMTLHYPCYNIFDRDTNHVIPATLVFDQWK